MLQSQPGMTRQQCSDMVTQEQPGGALKPDLTTDLWPRKHTFANKSNCKTFFLRKLWLKRNGWIFDIDLDYSFCITKLDIWYNVNLINSRNRNRLIRYIVQGFIPKQRFVYFNIIVGGSSIKMYENTMNEIIKQFPIHRKNETRIKVSYFYSQFQTKNKLYNLNILSKVISTKFSSSF